MKFTSISRIFLILILILSIILNVSAQFYADVTIDVDSTGSVNILGKTNYLPFENVSNSQIYTSKNSGVWTLNVSSLKTEIFDDFIFNLVLPENSQINYIKTTPNFRIENEGSRIKIIGTGENKPFTLLVQYKLNNISIFNTSNFYIFSLILALIIFLGIVIYFGNKLLKKENKIQNLEEEITEVIEDSDLIHPDHKIKFRKYNLSDFSQRQQKIINLLRERGSLTQDEITDIMKIPKSSASRNIKALEIKRIVEIIEKGRYNKIILNEKKLL